MKRTLPIILVLLAIVAVWYAAAIGMNAQWQNDVYRRAKMENVPATQFIVDTWNQDKPVLPTAHQVFGELWNTTVLVAPNKPRSLLFHAWVTFSATGLGFVLGSILGIGLAVLIIHNEAMNRSLMPWIVASQTIPILALAPLIVVIGFNIFTGTLGIPTDPARLMSKAIISAYLSFFPVAVGMVKGLRSPEVIQLDLMHTYNASASQTFWKLRWPAALPYLFASLKVGVAASLVGAIIGELPTGAVAGLGARLLAGSYYSQTIQIWSALFAASILAALLVIAVSVVEKLVNRRMGASSMSQLQHYLALVAGGLSAAALAFSLITPIEQGLLLKAFLALGTLSLLRFAVPIGLWADGALSVLGAVAVLTAIGVFVPAPPFFWMALIVAWLFAWLFVERLSRALAPRLADNAGLGLLIPLTFGLSLLVIWEVATRAGNVPQVILPPPSMIGARIAASVPTLWADFQQTFLKAVLIGYVLGCVLGFVVAVLIDRSPFLKAGLLPLGNFVSALPIVGVAPIMVMWFGFDWQSKAAVVVIMTFFPMLVNTIAGLNASSAIERDLMRTYAAGYWQTLLKLRLPAAGAFIFNALKINSTLALIGAIVAEFFGTPIVGMGFRISTEVGRMNVDMVWAEIAVAAVAGSVFYGVVVPIERGITFWHPSVRGA